VDDTNGLDLKPTPDAFTMKKNRMSDQERQVFQMEWPRAIIRIARELALIMERIRQFWANVCRKDEELRLKELHLAQREHAVSMLESDLSTKATTLQEIDRRQSEKDDRLIVAAADLSRREQAIVQREAQIETRARQIERENRETLEWVEIASRLLSGDLYIDRTIPHLRDDRTDRAIDGPLAERFSGSQRPDWVDRSIIACRDLGDTVAEVAAVKRAAHDREVELANLLAKAGPILSPSAKAVAREISEKVKVDPATAETIRRLNDQGRAR